MKLFINTFTINLILLTIGCSVLQPAKNSPVETAEMYIEPAEPSRVAFPPTMTPLSPELATVQTAIPVPPNGYFYHGVFPGSNTGEEDDLTIEWLQSYEKTVGKTAAWVYFSNNWYRDRKFPTETANWIRDSGSIPYIRLMLRSNLKFDGNESVFTLQNILDGQFNEDLHAWCKDARAFGTHLLVEYGTEVNSDSFAWSGIANGAGRTDGYGDPTQPDGPERFRDAYRHIVNICRAEKAENITWVFHVDGEDHPRESWNQMEKYYPGNEWVDWIGVSIYGAYSPEFRFWNDFETIMDDIHSRIITLAPDKPIIMAEFGTAKNNPLGDQTQWANKALTSLTSSRYLNVIGFAWWNERWQNDGNPANDTTMRVQDDPNLANVFKELVGDNAFVLGRITP